MNQDATLSWSKRFFSSQKCPVYWWGPPNLLFNGLSTSYVAKVSSSSLTYITAEVKNECSCTSAPLSYLNVTDSDKFVSKLDSHIIRKIYIKTDCQSRVNQNKVK